MVQIPASALAPSDYITPPKCNGWHRVQRVSDDSWCPGTIRVKVNGGAWFPRPDTIVNVAFSGVNLCTIDHDAERKLT